MKTAVLALLLALAWACAAYQVTYQTTESDCNITRSLPLYADLMAVIFEHLEHRRAPFLTSPALLGDLPILGKRTSTVTPRLSLARN